MWNYNRNQYLSRKRERMSDCFASSWKSDFVWCIYKKNCIGQSIWYRCCTSWVETSWYYRGYIPSVQFPNSPEKFGFSYDQLSDSFICPKGQQLKYHCLNCNKSTGKYLRCYQISGNICLECDRQVICFKWREIRRRILASNSYPAFFRSHQLIGTTEYWKMMRLRKIWAASFSV